MAWQKDFLVEERPHMDGTWGGTQRVYAFPNGYGASVIPEYKELTTKDGKYRRTPIKGCWEVAVLFEDELCYTTPLTDDVIRRLNDPQVDDILIKIRNLNS